MGAGSTLVAIDAGIVTATGGIHVGTAASIYANGNATFSGIVTASSFTGMVLIFKFKRNGSRMGTS